VWVDAIDESSSLGVLRYSGTRYSISATTDIMHFDQFEFSTRSVH